MSSHNASIIETYSNSLQKAFNLGNAGVSFLAAGEIDDALHYLTQSLALVNKLIENEGAAEVASIANEMTESKSEPSLFFETHPVPDLGDGGDEESNEMFYTYNQAWMCIPTTPKARHSLLPADTTCLMAAVILFNLALARHQQGELDRAAFIYKECLILLNSISQGTDCQSHATTSGFLMLAVSNNQAALSYQQGNFARAERLLQRVSLLHSEVLALLPADNDLKHLLSPDHFWSGQIPLMDEMIINVATMKVSPAGARAA